ncbi:hypothetical protein [Mucilaginibacter celer]|uniref:Uncharacterized protein n=1 Tax=Mucilaginibacter celer TaxID=2305508 RepID=A0A494VP26_9SPHI|nr:hypothetical protein [Mucilaginibacter celer]AYL97187.1 hypothetical protein HYN43_018565 [Mucilaginibacter celer]
MLRRLAFIPQHQFHVLINFSKQDERVLAVLPNEAGRFRVVDQGNVIAEVDFDHDNCVCCKGRLKRKVLSQLSHQIKEHYA